MDMKMPYEIVEWTGMDKSLGVLVNEEQKETVLVKPIPHDDIDAEWTTPPLGK